MTIALELAPTLPGDTASAAPAQGTPHRGGTLTIAVPTSPATLNEDITDSASLEVIEKMFSNNLFTLNAKNALIPSLATSYKESKNGLTYNIELRPGVKWSDGAPFTSKDVVFTFNRFLSVDPLVPTTLAKDVVSVKAMNRDEVAIKLKHPYGPFMVGLAGVTFVMEPKHVYGTQTVVKDSVANDHPIGTGPFILKQWVPNEKLILVRNPHYWGATTKDPIPWFNKVVVDIVTNSQTIIDGELSGQIDYIPRIALPPTAVKEFKTSTCCRAVLVHNTPQYQIMYTNTTRAPFNNLTVRRAIYMAITRRLLIQDAQTGNGSLPLAPIPPAYAQLYTPKINLMKQYPYDPTKAAQMLDSAGYKVENGERFGKAITLLYSSAATGPIVTNTGAIIKAELAKLTIKVNLVNLDLTAWATETYVKKSYTLSEIGLTSANDPAFGIQRVFACQATPTTEYTNASGFCTKRVTSLFHQAIAATTTSGRRRAYSQVQRIVDTKLPSYELGWLKTYVVVSRRVQNWEKSLKSTGGTFNITWSEAWFR